MAQKIIIDADPGIGDALAVVLAMIDPDLDVIALTAVGGAVSPVHAARNLTALVEALDPPKWPRIGVSEEGHRLHDAEVTCPISPQWQQRQRLLNGHGGLGDLVPGEADLHHPKEASKLMAELVRLHPNEIVLLTLGPLSNVALAADRDAEFLPRLKSIVSLAGTITAPGDVTSVAEFNVHHHPEAARAVLRSPSSKLLVPLDASQQAILTFEKYQRLGLSDETRLGRLIRAMLPYALRSHRQHLGMEGLWLSEVTALAAIARPKLFQQTKFSVDIEMDGMLTRGMTVFDRRPHPSGRNLIDIYDEVDAQGVLDYMTSLLESVCR